MLAANPGTFIILNAYAYPLKDEVLRLFHAAQIYFDTVVASATAKGWSGYDLPALVKEVGPERFLFGSAYPLRDPVTAQIRMKLQTDLDPRAREAIWIGNARRLLKLS